MQCRHRIITIAGIVVVLAAVGALLATSRSDPGQVDYVQAHEDGTVHIHPTPTPTPRGLNGPLSLDTSMVYEDGQRQLVVVATINNPPPEGWEMQSARIMVNADNNGWSLNTNLRRSRYEPSPIALNDDHISATIPLPDYADFADLTGPVLAQVYVSIQYEARINSETFDYPPNPYDEGTEDLDLVESLYIDLNDRDNWR